MNHKKSLGQPLAGFRSLPSALLIVVVLSTILFSLQGSAYAQSQEEKNYTITLKSRTFTPQPGIRSLLRDSLIIHLERGEKRRVYLQLQKHLKAEERVSLEKQGIKLLSYIGSYTWHATISDRQVLEFTSPAVIGRSPILGTIRWVGEIQPEDRINPKILAEGVAPHSRGTGDIVYLLVSFYNDVVLEEGRSLVEQAGGQVMGEINILNTLQVSGPERITRQLINLDAVQWVDQLPPEGEDDNDGLRGAMNVDVVQVAPYNLDGTDVTIGQWEVGNPGDGHPDFGMRITIGDPPATIADHATHVAGILLGDGVLSSTVGGAAAEWRGVATNANLVSFRRHAVGAGPNRALDVATTAGQYAIALAAPHNIALSTNSWGTGHYHQGNDYDVGCQFYDQLIRPDEGRGISIVASAGNQGPERSNVDWTTVRIPNSAKNTIEVGSVFSDTGNIVGTSSRGPTEDGRVKPEVVAPGDQVGGDQAITSTVPNEYIDDPLTGRNCAPGVPGPGPNTHGDDYCYPYDTMQGTSMSTPAVSGTAALMIQQYRTTYFGNTNNTERPLPSTIKAILVHTADDVTTDPNEHPGVDFTGPDYFSGYGRVDAEGAIDAIRDSRFREGLILSDNDEDIYTFEVPPGEDELRVTLAWDDMAANPGDALPNILKNDLDLLLINPDGDEFYPPWELDSTNPATPAVRNSYATETVADAHRDDVNVVEQVIVDNPEAGTWIVKVKASDLPYAYQRYSIIAGDQAGDQLQGKIDIMQVLDRSGSMGGYASDTSTDRKIEVLKFAADQFIEMMKPDIGNQLGLVQFNQEVVPFDAIHEADLAELTTVRAVLLRGTTVPSILHGGTTSIGDGLQEALNQLTSALADPDHDHVILLVSDGKENTPSWIADAQDDLIDNNIVVCPLGLGYGSGIDETKLKDLAEATGGTYRITSDDLVFRKFFMEVLAGAVDWDILVDPIGELAPGETVTIPVTITADQLGATFTAYWDGIDNAVQLELITPSPSGLTIKPATATLNDKIRYGSHPRYVFYQLDFPLSGTLAGELAGEWKMKLTGVSDLQQNVRYSASAFGEGGAQLDVAFDRLSHLTGDTVLMTARLNKKGVPLTGANIEVDCDVPIVGAGNVLHQAKVSRNELEKNRIIFGDTISLIDRKLQVLSEGAGADILKRGVSTLVLHDDGRHGDGKANDGLYANRFKDTKIAGTYTCRFVASGIPAAGGQTTTREWTKSFYNEVNINPDYSVVDVKLIRRVIDADLDGWKYGVNVVPRDKFGNYLGPGHPVLVTLACTDGSRQVELNDNIDGTYTEDIYVSQWELDRDAKLMIEIDGKTFATVEKLPTYNKWSISLHSGTAIPTSSFANDFDPGVNVVLDIDYRFSPQFSLVGLFGYNDFKSKTTGVDDNYWINLSANVRYQRPLRGLLSYYIGGGPGAYIPETGDTEFGANLGIGLDYDYSSFVTLEVGVDYHTVFGEDVQFVHSHAGLIFRF